MYNFVRGKKKEEIKKIPTYDFSYVCVSLEAQEG